MPSNTPFISSLIRAASTTAGFARLTVPIPRVADRNRGSYFSNEEILGHATTAIDILTRHDPDDDHVLFSTTPQRMRSGLQIHFLHSKYQLS
jgi:hypothetical protein